MTKINSALALAFFSSALIGNVFGQAPALPSIPTNVFKITDYGAVGDGKALNTEAIQKTIAAATKAGGGIVLVPEGNFLTMPFSLASKINFHVDRGATILLSDDLKNYPQSKNRYVDGISANGADDVAITGEGTIDGQGKNFWDAFEANHEMTHRPYLIKFQNCSRVLVRAVHIVNSPCFHLVPQNCADVTIQGITIHSPANAHNTDGIDPSGWNFLIENCAIDCGDDNIAIKPNTSRSPGDKNFLVRNCKFLHGHGMSIGSGTDGGIENVTVQNCSFDETDSGIRIKTLRGRGGVLQNLVYENVTMNAVKNPVYIIDWYPERTAPKDPATEKPEPINDRTPINKNIVMRNIVATNCPTAGTIRGLPEAPVSNVMFSNVTISAKVGMKIFHAKGIRFEKSKINVEKGNALTTFNAEVSGLE